MKNTAKIYIFLILFCFTSTLFSYAQNKTSETKLFVEKKEVALVQEDDFLKLSFKISGIEYDQSTKPFIEKASLIPEIKKLNISNVTDQNGQRTGYVLLQKDKYLSALTTTLNILEIAEINIENQKTDIPGYIEMCK